MLGLARYFFWSCLWQDAIALVLQDLQLKFCCLFGLVWTCSICIWYLVCSNCDLTNAAFLLQVLYSELMVIISCIQLHFVLGHVDSCSPCRHDVIGSWTRQSSHGTRRYLIVSSETSARRRPGSRHGKLMCIFNFRNLPPAFGLVVMSFSN